jgi:hypothetical protein
MRSSYTGDFRKSKQVEKVSRDFFNLEKEHKVINPHKMQLISQSKVIYSPSKFTD